MASGLVLPPLLTGLGLFLCGVTFVASNLPHLAGGSTRKLLKRATSANWRAAMTGVIAGLLTQSTNAVSLTVAGFVRAGVIPERRAVLLPTWSHVGAAALVIFVSLETNVAVAYVLAMVGIALYFDLNLSQRFRHATMALLGAGMLFLGMQMLKEASEPMRAWLVAHGIVGPGAALGPYGPAILGLVLAVLTQSSTVAGAIAVAMVRVGVFDLHVALFLLAGANAGSAFNYVLLGRKGEAVVRHIMLFQAAQKLFGTVWLVLLLSSLGVVLDQAILGIFSGAAAQFAMLFLSAQIAGSLACTLLRAPIAGLLLRIAPPNHEESLAKPAFLVDEALSDPALALDLVAREELRLLQRLPLVLEHLREDGDRTTPAADRLRSAGLAVGEAIRRYLAGVLEGEPGRAAVMRAMRLQQALNNITSLHEALGEFAAAARTAGEAGRAPDLEHMVESLHMLLGVLADIAGSEDPEEQALSMRLLGGREAVMESLRSRLMAASADTSARVQEALFRSTVLFERILWLARDTASALAPAATPAPRPEVQEPVAPELAAEPQPTVAAPSA